MNFSQQTGCAIIVEKLLRLLSYKLPGEPRKGFPHAAAAESGRMGLLPSRSASAELDLAN